MDERELVAGKVCPLCRGRGLSLEQVRGEHSALQAAVDAVGPEQGRYLRECRCVEGGVLLSWPHRSVEAYEAKYASGVYHDEEMEQSGRQAFVQRDTEYLKAAACRMERLGAAYPTHGCRLLDVGCGTGALVAMATARGMDAVGIEPNRALAGWAMAQGREVRAGNWMDVQARTGDGWDFIQMMDVLEHLVDPSGALRHLRECLKSDGVLVVEMPEYNAPHPRWTAHVKPYEHPVLYSWQAAIALFDRCGFRWDEIHRPLGGSLGKISFSLRAK